MTERDSITAADLAVEDLRQGLPDFELSSFDLDEDLSPESGVEVVAWHATLRLVRAFRGVPAGAEALPLRGVTLVKRASDGTPSFRRYIDWLDLFNRLGLNGAMRPVRVASPGGGTAGSG